MKPLLELEKLIKEAAAAKEESLVPAIERAIDSAIIEGHDVEDLVSLCISCGYTESYVRSTISKLLLQCRVRRRATGAGRRRDPDAITLLEHAIREYGASEASRILLAAYRLAIARTKKRR